MPSGATYDPGATPPIQPGTYVASRAKNPVAIAASFADVVLAFGRASWGPESISTDVASFSNAAEIYGSSSQLATLIQQAYLGGAGRVVGFRYGDFTSATAATYSAAGSSSTTLALNANYKGARTLSVEIRDCPYDTTLRECRIFVDSPATLRETIQFTKGGGGDTQGEIGALKAAIAAAASPWITAGAVGGTPTTGTTLTAVGTPTPVAFTAGTDPAYTGTYLSDGLNLCEGAQWKVLVSDLTDATSNTTIASFISRIRSQGYRRVAIVTEGVSTSTATLTTRCTDAAAINSRGIGFVANGFKDSTGNHHGYFAAATYAGMLAGTPTNRSTTHKLVPGATDVYDGTPTADKFNQANILKALASGLIVFTKNSVGQVQVEQGITTLVTLDADTDEGWKSMEIVRSRDDFVDRLVQRWDQLVGQVRNNNRGRGVFLSNALTVLEDCHAAEMIELYDAKGVVKSMVIEDPQKASSGRYAYFLATIKSVGAVEIVLLPITYSF